MGRCFNGTGHMERAHQLFSALSCWAMEAQRRKGLKGTNSTQRRLDGFSTEVIKDESISRKEGGDEHSLEGMNIQGSLRAKGGHWQCGGRRMV